MGATKSNSTAMEANQAKQSINGNSAAGDSILHSNLSVDTALSFPVMVPRVIALCKDLFPKWAELNESCFSVETVSGGITNLLLKVSVKEENGENVSVTVRLYGPNTDYVINRERELQAIKYLSAAGFGAKLLGVFGNGMVQSFIHARTLTPSDMRKPKLASEIAKQLRRFHQVEIPGSKEPQLWVDLFKFFEKASSLQFEDTDKQKLYETISFEEVHEEATQLKELTGLLNSPVVFAHNDLLSGNLMHNDEKEKLYFIDFEYGSYNYRGFDIGNHFNEYAGYDCDYSLYPNKDEQYHFFRHYLQPEKPYEVSEKDLEALYVETNTFMLASHIYWALWALIQARMSPIDFDYIEYFFLRYNEYKKQKEMFISLAKSHLSRSGKA
ncbi:choline/ethanolamine kinase 4, embryo defective 1187 [Hibiscus trionum]|uniref:ethanolamine kinase n=1 Tax=Hibiscus trionum TaxID=183268 RepID=A0A9W7M8C5_HIBTR|nr:choline/ethanolamine kinase 4, embryo defective 1187 [Hibiscus trionum]